MERKVVRGNTIEEQIASIDAALYRMDRRRKFPTKMLVPITPIIITGKLNETKGIIPMQATARIVYVNGSFEAGAELVVEITKGSISSSARIPIKKRQLDEAVDIGKIDIPTGSTFSVYVNGSGEGVFGMALEPVLNPTIRVDVEED